MSPAQVTSNNTTKRSSVVGILLRVVALVAFCALVGVAVGPWEGLGFFWKSVALVLFAVSLPWWFAWRLRVPLGWVALGLLVTLMAGVAAIIVWSMVINLGFPREGGH